jgi:hypothetical protein
MIMINVFIVSFIKVIICLYVDDISIFGTNYDSIVNTKNFLSSNFDMKDLGVADVILDIRIIRNNGGLILT